MASTFHLSVLTPEKTVFEEDVSYVLLPGLMGYFGVLSNHAPLISALAPGKFIVRDPGGQETVYSLSGGFFEVSGNSAVVLADAIERPDEIDADRAKKAEERARGRLKQAIGDSTIDVARAEVALKRALARQRMVGL